MIPLVAIDTETELIEPGLKIPRLVCLSWAEEECLDLVSYSDASEVIRTYAGAGYSFVGHNLAYDMAVLAANDFDLLPVVFDLYASARVYDTMIAQTLRYIAQGCLTPHLRKRSLSALAQKHLGLTLGKGEDTWRLRYSDLRDVPIESWPIEAIEYSLTDASATYRVAIEQIAKYGDFPDMALQCRAHFALTVMSAWGIRTDPDRVTSVLGKLQWDMLALQQELEDLGLLRNGGKKNLGTIRKAIVACLGELAPASDPSNKYPNGQVRYDDATLEICCDVCKKIGSDDRGLGTLREYSQAQSLYSKYAKVLEAGTSQPITTSYDPLKESGRTSSSDPNLQNLPRKTDIRSCFVPRPYHVFAGADFGSAELVSLAQVLYAWFGWSRMRDAIIEGRDLHLDLACLIIDKDYSWAVSNQDDPEVKNARQLAKIANFGYPGGLGAVAFVSFAKGYGVEISEDKGRWLKNLWYLKWPEMRLYFERIGQLTGETGTRQITQYWSGRLRGDVSFTQAANSMFQGLTADGAKIALWEVCRECYCDPDSPLYLSRPVLFIHDEIIMESPEALASDAAKRLAEVMISSMRVCITDVPVTAEPYLMRRWYKGAKAVYDNKGNLVPWEPKEKQRD